MLKLGIWEEFLINAVVSLLSTIEGKLTNPAEVAALQAAVDFLKSLNAGKVAAAA